MKGLQRDKLKTLHTSHDDIYMQNEISIPLLLNESVRMKKVSLNS
jgi:hypothetical protein